MQIEMRWLDYTDTKGKQCRTLQFRETYYESWRTVPVERGDNPHSKDAER